MNIRRNSSELPSVYIPVELVEDFDKCQGVNWRDNLDGTYTLIKLPI